MDDLRAFRDNHNRIVVKPLHGMGGKSIFVVEKGDNNANVIFETLTTDGSRYTMAQKYIPEITDGDKRIILIDGQAPEYVTPRAYPIRVTTAATSSWEQRRKRGS